jgi:hypothetical protein
MCVCVCVLYEHKKYIKSVRLFLYTYKRLVYLILTQQLRLPLSQLPHQHLERALLFSELLHFSVHLRLELLSLAHRSHKRVHSVL